MKGKALEFIRFQAFSYNIDYFFIITITKKVMLIKNLFKSYYMKVYFFISG
ncbi:MAG: hypothetical protein A370_02657 [Clostridium sp. Maddingley MBC34-26]|nr:MAG: hypothetical protein A370_02657 [Clostridium sp. Maddingley MBC34-26]